jgi:flagellar protein FlbD
MILLHRMNQKPVYVNPDLMRHLESTPDTVITFADGTTLMVRESPDTVISQIVEFKGQIQKKLFEMEKLVDVSGQKTKI